MDKFWDALIFFLVVFILGYLIYYFLFLKRRYNATFKVKKKNKKKKVKKEKKKKDIFSSMELSYLIVKFKLDPQKINLIWCLRIIALINSFIVASTSAIIYYLPWNAIMWKFLVGFVLIFGLIYALYEIFGRCLVKKGWVKDEHKKN